MCQQRDLAPDNMDMVSHDGYVQSPMALATRALRETTSTLITVMTTTIGSLITKMESAKRDVPVEKHKAPHPQAAAIRIS